MTLRCHRETEACRTSDFVVYVSPVSKERVWRKHTKEERRAQRSRRRKRRREEMEKQQTDLLEELQEEKRLKEEAKARA